MNSPFQACYIVLFSKTGQDREETRRSREEQGARKLVNQIYWMLSESTPT